MNVAGRIPLNYSGESPANEDTLIFDAGTGTWTPSSSINISPVNSGSSTTTDKALVRWEGTNGKTIQNSVATLSDTGVLSIPLAPLCSSLTFYQIGNTTDSISLVANTAPTANITITLPTNVSDTIATLTGTQTLTNKTLNGATINSANILTSTLNTPVMLTPSFSGISTGTFQNSSQYCFEAYMSAVQTGVTGSGNTVTIIFDTIAYQIGTGYDATTGLFTAPISGLYKFNTAVVLFNLLTGNTTVELSFYATIGGTNENSVIYLGQQLGDAQMYMVVNGSRIFNMSAGDTVCVDVNVGGNTSNNVSISNGQYGTWFQMHLLTSMP